MQLNISLSSIHFAIPLPKIPMPAETWLSNNPSMKYGNKQRPSPELCCVRARETQWSHGDCRISSPTKSRKTLSLFADNKEKPTKTQPTVIFISLSFGSALPITSHDQQTQLLYRCLTIWIRYQHSFRCLLTGSIESHTSTSRPLAFAVRHPLVYEEQSFPENFRHV